MNKSLAVTCIDVLLENILAQSVVEVSSGKEVYTFSKSLAVTWIGVLPEGILAQSAAEVPSG